MNIGNVFLAGSMLAFVGACTTSTSAVSPETDPAALEELPEGVIAIAAPNQNLQSVRIQPDDGCYWFQWVGPVETSYLPLRSRDGRPICARPQKTPVGG